VARGGDQRDHQFAYQMPTPQILLDARDANYGKQSARAAGSFNRVVSAVLFWNIHRDAAAASGAGGLATIKMKHLRR
jgi:hypothetical protein